MKVLIDADACPVTKIVIQYCQEIKIPVEVFFDDAHEFFSDYAKVYIISQGKDNVDFFLLKNIEKNDIVITQDYGLASLALAKNAMVINQNGFLYTNDNIDALLNSRFMSAKLRKSGIWTKGPAKRTIQNDKEFMMSFEKLINKCQN